LRFATHWTLAEQDRMQKSGLGMTRQWVDIIQQLDMLTRVQAAAPAGNTVPIGARKKRSSKRSLLGHLPADWQTVAISKIDPAYAVAALVQAITACRPAELVLGVEARVAANELVIAIKGVKVTKFAGHKLRVMRWSLAQPHALVAWMASLVEREPDAQLTISIDSAKAYSGRVRTAGRRAWPDLPASLSPYCFRHAAASIAKGEIDREAVARMLGHAVTDTASSYGSWHYRAGGAGLTPNSVEASGAVRSNHRNGPSRVGPAPGM
jgi:integrase